jgi:AraC-like DNA-binding protein
MTSALKQHVDSAFHCRTHIPQGPLGRFCKALLVVDVAAGPLPLTVLPHDSVVLSLQVAAGSDPFARATERGMLPHLCTWRSAPHSYVACGGCRSFFALLTPEGAIALSSGQALPRSVQPRRPLATLVDRTALVVLEDAIAMERDPVRQLAAFATWLEKRVEAGVRLPSQAVRAARIASRIFAGSTSSVRQLAAQEGISPRQMERDFDRWFDAAPKHASMVARVQAAARLSLHGHSLADIAHQLDFVDQSHLNRVIRKLFGASPSTLASRAPNALGRAFRHAAGGGLVYV